MEHAASNAFTFFAVVELALAGVAVKSGVLQTRLHWLARAGGAFVVGAGLSYLIVMGILWCGGLPPPIAELERTLAAWIQNMV